MGSNLTGVALEKEAGLGVAVSPIPSWRRCIFLLCSPLLNSREAPVAAANCDFWTGIWSWTPCGCHYWRFWQPTPILWKFRSSYAQAYLLPLPLQFFHLSRSDIPKIQIVFTLISTQVGSILTRRGLLTDFSIGTESLLKLTSGNSSSSSILSDFRSLVMKWTNYVSSDFFQRIIKIDYGWMRNGLTGWLAWLSWSWYTSTWGSDRSRSSWSPSNIWRCKSEWWRWLSSSPGHSTPSAPPLRPK